MNWHAWTTGKVVRSLFVRANCRSYSKVQPDWNPLVTWPSYKYYTRAEYKGKRVLPDWETPYLLVNPLPIIMHICVMVKLIGIYMGDLVQGFCFLKLFLIIGKGLTLSSVDSSFKRGPAHMNLYRVFILGVNIEYRLCYSSLPPYGSYIGERVKKIWAQKH